MPDLPDDLRAVLADRATHAPAPPPPGDALVRRVRRRRAVRVGAATGGTTLAVVAVVAVGAAALGGPARPADPVATGSCDPITDHAADAGGEHRQERVGYPRTPPNSGPHFPVPLPPGPKVHPRIDANGVERAVHNLEHGYVVVWYDPERADDAALADAVDIGETKVLAVPWPRGDLPAPYVLTAWGHEQRCADISPAAVEDFFAEHGHTNGDAPEKQAL